MRTNILILSCGTGEGHNSAAIAVKCALEQLGAFCEMRDPVSFAGEKAKRVVSGAYNSIIKKTPKMFGAIYRAGELYDRTRLRSPVYMANTLYAKNLLNYISEKHFDAVLCTHLYGMEALTGLRKKEALSIPCFGVLTDYTCIPFFEETRLDFYFIPHSDLTEELVSKGMNPEQLIPTGIPVNPKFSVHAEKMQARSILELPLESKIVLVMTGGVGCGKIEEICDALPMADERCLICVLTGHNKDMKARLEAKYDAKRLRAFGFTDKVNLFMNAADAMITKPGGLSSTEAAVACVPTVHLISVPGCEQRNAAFFAAHGLSLVADSPQNAARLAVSLANDCEAAQQMRKRQHEHINPHAAEDIARKVMQS